MVMDTSGDIFVSGLGITKRVTAHQSGIDQKVYGVIYRSAAYAQVRLCQETTQSVDRKMIVHLQHFLQHTKAFMSLTQPVTLLICSRLIMATNFRKSPDITCSHT